MEEKKYSVKCCVKVRLPNEKNKSKVSWFKLDSITLTGNSVEEIIEKAYAHPVPDDVDIEAIHLQGTIRLMERSTRSRKDISIDVFREL